MQNYLCDNHGNVVPPDVNAADPIAASGQTAGTGTAGDDVTFTVVGGGIYALTPIGSAILVSCTEKTSTAANIEWVAAAGQTIIVKVPEGKTTIYFEGDTSSKNVYLRRLR
jgi:expansin (peptidoglycan-binding protein)